MNWVLDANSWQGGSIEKCSKTNEFLLTINKPNYVLNLVKKSK